MEKNNIFFYLGNLQTSHSAGQMEREHGVFIALVHRGVITYQNLNYRYPTFDLFRKKKFDTYSPIPKMLI